MKPSQVTQVLAVALPSRKNVLLVGPPGVGKTSLVEAAAQAAGMRLIVSHPAVSDPTDAKGLPWMQPGDTQARFMPYGELAEVLEATEPTVWFLDDLGQAPPAVQASFMPYLLARRCGSHVLPDCVTILAATNGREHRAGVSGLLGPVKSRFATILEVEPDLESWQDWALTHGVDPFVIAFVRQYPDKLCAVEVSPGLTNEHNPRTIVNAAGWLQDVSAGRLPESLLMGCMSGAVGQGWTTEFLAFRAMCRSMVSADQILTDPNGAPLPDGPSQSFATITGLAMKTTAQNFGRGAIYAQRLAENDRGEFAAMFVKDVVRRSPAIQHSPDYMRLVSGELGRLILGTSVED